jgi:GntR family transcriptional repressor for pyruvate dehydrogenase complex
MELLQARRFIETTVSKLAFFNIRTNELEKLNDILHAMEQAIKDKNLQAYAAKDIEFHMLIASASQNRYLVHMYIIVVNLMDQFIEQSFEVLPAMALDSIKHHKAIYKSLYEHNEVAFQAAIKGHLDNIITAVANYYAGKK